MTSAARPLDPLFSPRSVAVVGASRDRGSIGFSILDNLLSNRFEGAIYPVNPRAQSIHSLRAYPSITAIADPVDLAVIVVPRQFVLGAVEEALAKPVRGLVVISAGFAEVGEEGRQREAQLREMVRAAGVRMVGPNCMGIINTDPEISLNATFAPVPAERGGIGFVSQSGALGVAILNVARTLGIGLTQFVSMGNKADISGNDLLEHWENDPQTRVVCMYLESFGNPRRFTEIAKRVSHTKPILIVKSGRTAEGARAASSHTGSLAGADVTVSAFLDRCGVLRAATIEELFDVARALDRCPLPAGPRVAILTNAGGPAIMATDACVDLGLEIAPLAEGTRERLAAQLPAEASVQNPVDMIASANAESYRRSLETLLVDPNVDMVLVINVTPLVSSPKDILEAVGESARAGSAAAKPVLAVMMAEEDFYAEVKHRHDLPPVYRFPESAARTLLMLHRYAAWRRRPADEARPRFDVDDAAVAALLLRADPADGYLTPADTFAVLERYGIPLAGWRMTANADEAAGAARELGYPVALKAVARGLVHKSELGAVAVGLEDEAELRAAVARMGSAIATAGFGLDGFLVQEMASSGHETIFGISTDPRFGPLLMFGLGGKYVEVFNDVRFGVTPLRPSEALEMVRSIRGFKLLSGVRGEEAADIDVLVDVLLRLSLLAERHPEIAELDLNPFLAAPRGKRALAVDARLRVRR